jgi:hypothetical protein
MTLRWLSLFCLLCGCPGFVASTDDVPKGGWRGPLQLVKNFFLPNGLLQAATDISRTPANDDESLNVSMLRDDSNEDGGESLISEEEIQHESDAQGKNINSAANTMLPEASKFYKYLSEEVLSDRSIVFDSTVEISTMPREMAGLQPTKSHSRTFKSTDDKFCTQDCSSRSYLPSNPEGYSFGSHDRW